MEVNYPYFSNEFLTSVLLSVISMLFPLSSPEGPSEAETDKKPPETTKQKTAGKSKDQVSGPIFAHDV